LTHDEKALKTASLQGGKSQNDGDMGIKKKGKLRKKDLRGKILKDYGNPSIPKRDATPRKVELR